MENAFIQQSASEEKQSQNKEILMGHRSSKSAVSNSNICTDISRRKNITASSTTKPPSSVTATSSNCGNNRIPILPLPSSAINVQIQESPLASSVDFTASLSTRQSNSGNSSLTSLAGSSLQNQQIIITIQLAKMENGNDSQATTTHASTRRVDSEESSINLIASEAEKNNMDTSAANNSTQFVNLTINGNFIYKEDETNELMSLSTENNRASQTAGGFNSSINNNVNDLNEGLNSLQIQEDWEQQSGVDGTPEYCEVLSDTPGSSSATNSIQASNELRRSDSSINDTIGCLNGHRRAKTTCRNTTSTGHHPRRRCRDALRRIFEPATNKPVNKSKKVIKKHCDTSTTQAAPTVSTTSLATTSSQRHLMNTASQRAHNINPLSPTTSMASTSTTMTLATTSNNVIPIAIGATTNSNRDNPTNQVSAAIWGHIDELFTAIPQSQLVVLQYPPTRMVTLAPLRHIDFNSIRLSNAEIGQAGINNGFTEPSVKQANNGPIVHSQVDFVHCLVPDLDKIVNSSFYWGKIDRYEAERLLEGKPEGTFLLRDSAQEEYLFSVTFRKFGRSLHARIEQSGHKFGFDCHDPSVFTAPTVTGLLQHYKDSACVMFFEPMLSIPLHRKTTFSLQELARGVIVANTTYDGINELGLPMRLRVFLKEYYYKQKLRVKPFGKLDFQCA